MFIFHTQTPKEHLLFLSISVEQWAVPYCFHIYLGFGHLSSGTLPRNGTVRIFKNKNNLMAARDCFRTMFPGR